MEWGEVFPMAASAVKTGWLTALFGGMPATGAIARTDTNIRAGGQTPSRHRTRASTVPVRPSPVPGPVVFLMRADQQRRFPNADGRNFPMPVSKTV